MSFQYQLDNGPQDIVSALHFNPTNENSNLLLASSWDSTLNLYDTSVEGGRLLTRVDGVAPLLDCCWDRSGRSAFIGGLENKVRQIDLETGNCTILTEHVQAVKSLAYHKPSGLIASGSWDRTVQLTDTRDKRKFRVFQQPHKVFTMDMTENLLVVGMASRSIYVYDIRNMAEPFQRRESNLKHTTRVIKCIPTGEGFASASIEGRIAVDFFDPSAQVQARKYAFKCHRDNQGDVDTVYPVNALAFHPLYGTFASGGNDSLVCFWDYKARKRMRQYPRYQGPIQCLEIDSKGTSLAIAYGGETEVGYNENTSTPNGIIIRPLVPGEGKSKS
ncbi:WD40-repeat-containing domain protein [Lipomyces arxii]|uniref:WD40-repeat-containing domain protein n=1 Tax=Lipomyces arxii TaxID=56418 RepID=UPI0034CE435E